ncbi:MAG: N-acetyltransferase family protein [Candidatus Sulfotelmatobacter sp.]
MITPMEPEDWPAVCEIYRQGIATGNATFETELPDWQTWNNSHRPDCRLVARERKTVDRSDGMLLGWAALRPVSSRRVYAGVAEVSVYVAKIARGKGFGRLLLQSLVEESEGKGIWTLQAGIFPENIPSIKVHESLGFREIGLRSRIGKMGDLWRDVLLLERRSATVGL